MVMNRGGGAPAASDPKQRASSAAVAPLRGAPAAPPSSARGSAKPRARAARQRSALAPLNAAGAAAGGGPK